jgi:hypothetical protein
VPADQAYGRRGVLLRIEAGAGRAMTGRGLGERCLSFLCRAGACLRCGCWAKLLISPTQPEKTKIVKRLPPNGAPRVCVQNHPSTGKSHPPDSKTSFLSALLWSALLLVLAQPSAEELSLTCPLRTCWRAQTFTATQAYAQYRLRAQPGAARTPTDPGSTAGRPPKPHRPRGLRARFETG